MLILFLSRLYGGILKSNKTKHSSSFLSRLYGGIQGKTEVKAKPIFLSRLYGGIPIDRQPQNDGNFLSRLYGGIRGHRAHFSRRKFLSRLYGGIRGPCLREKQKNFLSRLYGGILHPKLRTTAKILGFLHFSANHPNFPLAIFPLFCGLSQSYSKFGSKFWHGGEVIQSIAAKPHHLFLILCNTFYAQAVFLLVCFAVHLHKGDFFRRRFQWEKF